MPSTITKFHNYHRRGRARDYPIEEMRASGTASRTGDEPWIGEVRAVIGADGSVVVLHLDTEDASTFALDLLEAALSARGRPKFSGGRDFEPLPPVLEARLREAAAWTRPAPAVVAEPAPWPKRPVAERAAMLPPNYADQLLNLADADDHGLIGGWRVLEDIPVYDDARDHLVAAGTVQLAPHLPGCGRCTSDGLAVAAEVRRLRGLTR